MINGVLTLALALTALIWPNVFERFVALITERLGQHLYLIIFSVALTEAIFPIGLIVPGSFALVVLVAAAVEGLYDGALICTLGVVAISSAYLLNAFVLARLSSMRGVEFVTRSLKSRNRFAEAVLLMLAPAVPSYGGAVAFALGLSAERRTARLCLLLAGVVFWVIAVYWLVVLLGSGFLNFFGESGRLLALLLIAYALVELYFSFRRPRRPSL
jgi:hypothetical protein